MLAFKKLLPPFKKQIVGSQNSTTLSAQTISEEYPRKYVNVFMTEAFIEFQAYRSHITPCKTVVDSRVFLSNVSDDTLGQMLEIALYRSRLFPQEAHLDVVSACASHYGAWSEERMAQFGYEGQYEFFQNMRSCFITSCAGKIIMIPQHHIELARWTHEKKYGITHFVFSENATSSALGAGLRLAFNSCTSRGVFDVSDLPSGKVQKNKLNFAVFGDVTVNYSYMNFYFDGDDRNFMDICISDDRELVFMFFQSTHEFQLNLTEWDQMQLEAEMFLPETLHNDEQCQKSRRQYKESEE